MRELCLSGFVLIGIVSLVNLVREPKLFGECVGGGVVIWLATLIIPFFTDHTASQWIWSGAAFFVGGGILIANIGTFLIHGIEFGHIDTNRLPDNDPYIETVYGEPVPDYPELASQNPQQVRLLTSHNSFSGYTSDPVYCDDCDAVTWQEYHDGQYVCDHNPGNRATYKRSK